MRDMLLLILAVSLPPYCAARAFIIVETFHQLTESPCRSVHGLATTSMEDPKFHDTVFFLPLRSAKALAMRMSPSRVHTEGTERDSCRAVKS